MFIFPIRLTRWGLPTGDLSIVGRLRFILAVWLGLLADWVRPDISLADIKVGMSAATERRARTAIVSVLRQYFETNERRAEWKRSVIPVAINVADPWDTRRRA